MWMTNSSIRLLSRSNRSRFLAWQREVLSIAVANNQQHLRSNDRKFSTTRQPSAEAKKKGGRPRSSNNKQIQEGRNMMSNNDNRPKPGRPQNRENAKEQPQKRYGSKRGTTQAILRELIEGINTLSIRANDLDELPPIWSSEVISDDVDRREIFVKTKELFARIQSCVKDRMLQPSSQHNREVSVLLERILRLYSSVSVLSGESVFDECSLVLSLMQTWKVDLQHKHCEYASMVAAYESRWYEAAKLFSSRIDPDSGFAPYDVSVADPVGLYAVARNAQERGASVVDSVFDAVLRMSMVSPSDQNKYILAAGTAIGHAGEWEDFVNYLQTSYNATQMGQTLLAAVMHACLLCNRCDEALQVYDKAIGDCAIAGEWQWGGGQDTLDPILKDLAIRALGGCHSSSEDPGDRAIQLMKEIEAERKAISIDALCGAIEACQISGRLDDIISIFFTVLGKSYSTAWLDRGDDLLVSDLDSPGGFNLELLPTLGFFLDSIMRSCNSSGQFGAALLIFRLFELSLPRSFVDTCQFDVFEDGTHQGVIAKTFCPTICALTNSSDLLASTMVALCGLSCPHEAVSLYETALSLNQSIGISHVKELYNYASQEALKEKPLTVHPSYAASHRHLHRVTAALQTVFVSKEKLTQKDSHILSSALSAAINSLTLSSHPEAGIILAKWVDRLSSNPIMSSEREEVNTAKTISLPITDSLLASVIEAHWIAGTALSGLELFKHHTLSNKDSLPMPLSSIAAMRILFDQGDHGEAMDIFHKIVKESPSPNLFTEASKGLTQAGKWNAAAGLYRLALASSCNSEELSLLTLRAVSRSRGKGRIKIMRNIIEEIARDVGSSPTKWIEVKYWDLKYLVGFSDACKLMWWNDPKTSHLDELQLALDSLENRAASELTPKNAALKAIVASARRFYPEYIPPERTRLPLLPRDEKGWIETLSFVMEQAEMSTLYDNSKFMEEVALAFSSLGRADLSVKCVNDALTRGVRINPSVLAKVVEAVDSSPGISEPTEEIRMMIANSS